MGRQLNALDMGCMALALIEAGHAAFRGERPFGCVIVDAFGQVIGDGGGSESAVDPTRHSEMEAIRMACGFQDGYLDGCTLYSTHEPCLMCTGAILHAKVSDVVYGSSREDLPMLFRPYGSGWERWLDTTHPPTVTAGCLRDRCIKLFDQEMLAMTRDQIRPRGVTG